MKKICCTLLIVCLGFSVCYAQSKQRTISYDLYDMLQKNQLTVVGRNVTPFSEKGYKGIHVDSGQGRGIIWLKNVEFENAIIEVDIRGRDAFQKNFIGVAFHGVNDSTFEDVYFRPFNFRSTDSVRRIHAVQYESRPEYTWYRLREERNGQYEKGINPAPLATDWFHAKFVVRYPRVEVFVNGNKTASLSIEQLSNRKKGKFGLQLDSGTEGEYANLKVTFLR